MTPYRGYFYRKIYLKLMILVSLILLFEHRAAQPNRKLPAEGARFLTLAGNPPGRTITMVLFHFHFRGGKRRVFEGDGIGRKI